MNTARRRPLSLNNLRAFEAVARLASFSAAADELFLTQSAVSRQIKSLEDELGAALFSRGTRHVEPTPDAQLLLRSVEPWLARLDAGVRQIREQRTRRRVNVHTFASFASLWLLPRIEAFQRQHPDIDIRVSAHDAMSDLDDPEVDLILRYCSPAQAPAGAVRLFGETLTPAVSRQLMERIRAGEAPAMARPADLARHTLAEEDDHRASAEYLSWRHWLAQHGEPTLQPRRWLYLNFTYQQVQAALAGHGVALARVALVSDALERGELVEPFGAAGRITSPYCYWLITSPAHRARADVAQFCDWVEAQAALTRTATGEDEAGAATPPRPAR
ncbi:LysR substrate-binding domain-containing protein [Piscinibacter sp.]|uniref:LysR substrate-binding domain-containing protein n=1 Tax=Piscinibacter sp. TaxID=1903157 RepID=UPI0035B19C75